MSSQSGRLLLTIQSERGVPYRRDRYTEGTESTSVFVRFNEVGVLAERQTENLCIYSSVYTLGPYLQPFLYTPGTDRQT